MFPYHCRLIDAMNEGGLQPEDFALIRFAKKIRNEEAHRAVHSSDFQDIVKIFTIDTSLSDKA